LHVNIAGSSKSGTKAKVHFDQGRTLDSKSSGSVDYTTGPIKKKINAKAKTTYTYTFTKAGYSPGTVSYDSAVYRCDNYYGTSGCAIPESPTGVSLINQPIIADGIRGLRSRGGHYGDPYGGKPLHWMINDKQKNKNRAAVCPKNPPADMKRAGRTSCDEYPFASTYEGGTHLPAKERTITWVRKAENDSQGGTITTWRRAYHVMDHDPFFVIVRTAAPPCARSKVLLPGRLGEERLGCETGVVHAGPRSGVHRRPRRERLPHRLHRTRRIPRRDALRLALRTRRRRQRHRPADHRHRTPAAHPPDP
jgi:hypothetical protein